MGFIKDVNVLYFCCWNAVAVILITINQISYRQKQSKNVKAILFPSYILIANPVWQQKYCFTLISKISCEEKLMKHQAMLQIAPHANQ